MNAYKTRVVDSVLADAMAAFPAVMVVGPRACGKTTSAVRTAGSVVRLDDPADANRYLLAADESLRREQSLPVLLDEWQSVPDILGAVKRAVDDDPTPGRYVITGSVRAERALPTWPLTGRARRIRMYGLTMSELAGTFDTPGFLARLHAGGVGTVTSSSGSASSVSDYVDAALAGMSPYPRLHLSSSQQRDWYGSHVDHVVFRDLVDLEPARDPIRLRRFLHAYALNTAGVVPLNTVYAAAQVDQRTAGVYERLLADLFLVEDLPAYVSNRLKRLVRMPKRCLVDPAVLAPLAGVDHDGFLANDDLLGRLLETFAIAQLRPEAAMTDVVLHHLREEQGRREVDVIAEFPDGRVVAIEVKATSMPTMKAARHLAYVRDALGDQFVGGVLLHTGRGVTPLEDRLVAAPISSLWSAG